MDRRFLPLVLGSLILGNLPAASYTLEEIRLPRSLATAINHEGEIVGSAGAFQVMHSPVLFAWKGGVFTEFPDPLLPPDLRQSYATAVNDSGTIVGWAAFSVSNGPTPSRPRAGFYYHPSLGVMRIDGPEDCERVEPTSINNHGVVTGVFYPEANSNVGQPFLLEDGTVESLAGIFQMSGMAPVAINDAGAIVANPQPASSDNVPLGVAVLYADGIARKLLPPNCSHSEAVAINESGTVLLRAKFTNQTVVRPFLYKDGVYTDLTSVAGGEGFALECPWATVNLTQNALNDNGDIVGGIAGRPVLFSGGAFVELEPMVQLGEKRFWPTGVTNSGRILAQIFEAVTDTTGHPGVLTYSDEPPPEPEPEPVVEKAIYRYISIGGLGISLADLSDSNAFVARVNTSTTTPYLVDKAWDFETGFLSIDPPSPHPDVTLSRDLVSIDSEGRVAGYAHPHGQVGGGGAFIFDEGDFTFVPNVDHFVDDGDNGKFLGI